MSTLEAEVSNASPKRELIDRNEIDEGFRGLMRDPNRNIKLYLRDMTRYDRHDLSVDELTGIYHPIARMKREILSYIVKMPQFRQRIRASEQDLKSGKLRIEQLVTSSKMDEEEKNVALGQTLDLLRRIIKLPDKHRGKWLYARTTIMLNNSELENIYNSFISEIGNRIQRISQDNMSPSEKIAEKKLLKKESGLEYPWLEKVFSTIANYEKDIEAKHNYVFNCNWKLAYSIAKQYEGRGVPLLDLIQEANIGLMTAIRRHDYRRKTKISTYATWWIREAVRRAVFDQGRTIKYPVRVIEIMYMMPHIEKKFIDFHGRKPTVNEYAKILDEHPNKIRRIMALEKHEPYSLDDPISMDDPESGTRADRIADPAAESPLAYVQQKALQEEIELALKGLSEREAEIIRDRFGLEGREPKTLQEIGQRFKITRERTRQLEAKALRKLGHPKRSTSLKSFTRSVN